MLLLHAFGGVALALSTVGCLYALAAALLAGRLRSPSPAADGPRPAVTVLKPLRGAEPGLVEALETFARQDYPGPVQIVCGIQDPADPARAAVEDLRRRCPQAEVTEVVDASLHGENGKVSNLINMMGAARHELIVLSDSDIAVRPDYLARVAAALAESGVGAVTCYYHGQPAAGVWSRLASMGVSYGFLPNVLVGVALGAARPCMGSTIALPRSVLDRIGGFGRFADVLADDYEIGRAVRDAGYRVVLPPFAVAHRDVDSSFGELYRHELRWAATVRLIDPAGHAGSVVTHALPLAVIGAALAGSLPFGAAAIAAALVCRLCLKLSIDRAVGSSGPWALMPVRDMLSFVVFIGSLFARAVYWRGARFGVSSPRKVSAV